jgi:hypothetical protein
MADRASNNILSVTGNGTEKCEVPGCIMHKVVSFSSITPASPDAKVSFQARVHFLTYKELLDHAAESVKRVIQQDFARKGTFPTDRIVNVYHTGKATQSEEELLIEMQSKSATEIEQELALRFKELELLQKVQAQKAALLAKK